MAQMISAPHAVDFTKTTIFLGGTIDNGSSVDWQQSVIDSFEGYDILLINPRRDTWDTTIEQRMSCPEFKEQVDWELSSMEQCDMILFNFLSNNLSPITLLELGIHSKTTNVYVSCYDEFWRKGNIEITCDRYKIPFFDNLEDAIEGIKKDLVL